MTMRVQLTRKLRLEAPIREADGAGGFRLTWQPLGWVWAEVLPRGGSQSENIVRLGLQITVRNVPQGAAARPTPSQRFVDGARLYVIEAVTEADAQGRYLICLATEETGA